MYQMKLEGTTKDHVWSLLATFDDSTQFGVQADDRTYMIVPYMTDEMNLYLGDRMSITQANVAEAFNCGSVTLNED
jgi:hypothetical protein